MSDNFEILNAPNNILKGRVELETTVLNSLYYKILYNIQRDNRQYIIKSKKVEELSEEQLQLLKELDDLDSLKCVLSRNEIYNIIKRKNERTNENILEKFKKLQKTVFKFTTGECSDMSGEVQTQLIGAVKNCEDGYLMSVNAGLYKYLFYSVGIGYTPINLVMFFNFKSQHTRSLYAFLRSWSGTKERISISLKSLREEVFHLNESNYREYKKFNARVLSKAVEEIEQLGNMHIRVKEIRNGRRSVEKIEFYVIDSEPRFILSENKQEDFFSREENKTPVYWLDVIKIENQQLKNHLQIKYKDYMTESPIVKNIFIRAFEKTIEKDSNNVSMLQNEKSKSNIALFHTILTGELETHRLTSQKNY